MSTYGRIKRNRMKVADRWVAVPSDRRERKIGIDLVTHRSGTGYVARICLRGGTSMATRGHGHPRSRCGVGDARSVQSAVAKAMKALSRKIALRGRRY